MVEGENNRKLNIRDWDETMGKWGSIRPNSECGSNGIMFERLLDF
jgi:hypothetical protein